jgi:hypothetical protein
MRYGKKATIAIFLAMPAAGVSAALAQAPSPGMNYTSFDANSVKAVQLGYYGFARRDCSAGPLPAIRVVEPPKSGTLTIRRGLLTTNRVAGCPALKVPAQVAFYRARAGASGTDHIVYVVSNADGLANAYDVTINIRAAPGALQPDNPI